MTRRPPVVAILAAIGLLFVGGGVGMLPALVSGDTVFMLMFAALLGLGLICIVLAWILWRRQPGQTAIVKAETVTLTKEDAPRYARRGLIILVSLYKPFASPGSQPPIVDNSPEARRKRAEERLRHAEDGDWSAFSFEDSTLAPVLRAIADQSTQLEHCWFVGTKTQARDGNKLNESLTYMKALEGYLRAKNMVRAGVAFHYSPNYAVTLQEDAQVAIKTRDIINDIFTKAHAEYGLGDRDIVADFTGCPRSMALGLIWACLDMRRDIQFVATQYDDEGRSAGSLTPIRYSFETRAVSQS